MLSFLEVQNFKSIEKCSLNLKQENIIVGPNGVGKSNLLDAILFLKDASTDGLDHAIARRHGINSIRRWSKTRPYNISILMKFRHKRSYGTYKVVIASSQGDFSVVEEEGSWTDYNPIARPADENTLVTATFKRDSKNKVSITVPENPFEKSGDRELPPADLFITRTSPASSGLISIFFRGLYSELSSFGAYSIYPNKIREPQSISNAETLAEDGTNLASIVRNMRSTTYRSLREALTSALKEVLPIVSEIRIETAGGFYVPVFRVKDSENGYAHDLNMSQISDGTLRMLGMLTAFYQPKAPTKIALEEPEQMIHPGLLPVLVEASRDYLELGNENRQTFFTTHSPSFLDLFNPNDIIGTRFEDGVSKFNNLTGRQLKIVKDRLFSAGELLLAEGFHG